MILKEMDISIARYVVIESMENYALKKISEKHFERLYKKYYEEQAELESTIKNCREEIDNYNKNKIDTNNFLKMIKKYTDIEELTTPMINEFIEKIIVHEATRGRKGEQRKQEIHVYFNFIGDFKNIEVG